MLTAWKHGRIQAQICGLLDSLVHGEQSETNPSSTACFICELWSIKQVPQIFLPIVSVQINSPSFHHYKSESIHQIRF